VERSLRYSLLLAPVVALLLALAALYGIPGAATAQRPRPAGEPSAENRLATLVKTGEPIELTVQDVIPIEEADTHAVLLVSKDQAFLLPLFVTEEAAVSIAFRLAERTSPHPLAADLMDDMVLKLGGKVTQVEIDDVKDDVYTSLITISQAGKDVELAARPSDAIAMALTGKARIFCSPKVMAEAGITREEIESLQRGGDPGIGGSGPGGEVPEDHPGLIGPGSADDESNIRL
jgi:bifunctional DNase/RNase